MLLIKLIKKNGLLIAVWYSLLSVNPALAQLNQDCQVTISGQTVNVGFGGEFRVRNIPAGPNLVRLSAICTEDGKTRYGRSGFFQIIDDQTFHISELDLVWSNTPFPTTSSITAIPDVPTLTDSGQTTQVRVTATLSDGTQKDVTARGFGSTYSSSNPAIATVAENGVVTAVDRGIAFITVNNEGATAVTSVVVSPGDPLTTVEGFVFDENGQPIEGASVQMLGNSGSAITQQDGGFSISGVATNFGFLSVLAKVTTDSSEISGLAFGLEPIPGGFTDAGILTPVARNGLVMQMYDTPNHCTAVDNCFDGLSPGQFTVRTVDTTITTSTYVIPVVNFPETNFDCQAFYNVGPNGFIDPGSTALAPQGDDISIQPPGGNDNFGTSFTGFLFLPQGGDVTFTVCVDDAFDLIVDGESVLSHLCNTPFRCFSKKVSGLPLGIVPITICFGENTQDANIVLSATGAGLPGGVIPKEFLFAESPEIMKAVSNNVEYEIK